MVGVCPLDVVFKILSRVCFNEFPLSTEGEDVVMIVMKCYDLSSVVR